MLTSARAGVSQLIPICGLIRRLLRQPQTPVAMGSASSNVLPARCDNQLPRSVSAANRACDLEELTEMSVTTTEPACADVLNDRNDRTTRRLTGVCDMGTHEVENEAELRFLLPDYPLPDVQILEDGLLVRRTGTSGPCLVYLNRAIRDGDVLSVVVADVGPNADTGQPPYGFVFGVTTCEIKNIREDEFHATRICNELTCPYESFSRRIGITTNVTTGSTFKVEQESGASLSITVNGKKREIEEHKKLFGAERPVPFFLLSNHVSALRIVRDNGIAQMHPVNTHRLASPIIESPRLNSSNELFTFFAHPEADNNMSISEDGKLVTRKSMTGSKIVYFNREIGSDRKLTLIVRQSNTTESTNCLIVGVETCDPESITKYDSHCRTSCSNGSPCHGHSIAIQVANTPTNCMPGSLIVMEKDEQSVTIDINGQKSRINDKKQHFAGRRAYPFMILSGNVGSVKIIDEAAGNISSFPSSNSVPDQRPISSTVPKAIVQLTAQPQAQISDTYRFFKPSYKLPLVQLSDQLKTASRKTSIGPPITFFDRPLEQGVRLTLCVKQETVNPANTWSFLFGVSTCDLAAVDKYECHAKTMCCPPAKCQGISYFHYVPISVHVGHVVHFERTQNELRTTFMAADGSLHSQSHNIAKHLSNKKASPFIKLSGNADAVTIIDSNQSHQVLPLRQPLSLKLPTLIPPLSHSISTSAASYTAAALSSASSHATVSPNAGSVASKKRKRTRRKKGVHAITNSIVSSAVSLSSSSSNISVITSIANPPRVSLKTVGTQTEYSVMKRIRTGTSFPARKWYNNPFVRFGDKIITRIDNPDGRNFIFSREMFVNESIRFKVLESDDTSLTSLCFGVTTNEPLVIDLSSLPSQASELATDKYSAHWNFCDDILKDQCITTSYELKRTVQGIVLSSDQGLGAKLLIPDVEASSAVYPFFFLNGCIQSIEQEPEPVIPPVTRKNRLALKISATIFFCYSLLLKLQTKQ